MRLSFHSHKGGQGRSFIAFNLGRAFAIMGKRVLFVEGDPLGFSSNLGVKEGLVSSIIKGIDVKVTTLRLGQGAMDVIKLFSEDYFMGDEVTLLTKDGHILNKFKEAYSSFILRGYDVYIFDAPRTGLEQVIEAERSVFRSILPTEKDRIILVKDYVSPLREVLDFVKKVVVSECSEVFGLVVNMVPPDEVLNAVSELKSAVEALGLKVGVVVKFSEEYFSLEDPVNVDVPYQLKEMARAILNDEKAIIY